MGIYYKFSCMSAKLKCSLFIKPGFKNKELSKNMFSKFNVLTCFEAWFE